MSSTDGTPGAGQRGVLGGLLDPLRLPARALKALESLAGAAQHLAPMRTELGRARESIEPLADLVERTRDQTEQVPLIPPVVERISEQSEPLEHLLPALANLEESLGARLVSLHEVIVALEGDESHLNNAVVALGEQMDAMHATVRSLQDDVRRVTARLPDPEERGTLVEKAKDVLTGGGQ